MHHLARARTQRRGALTPLLLFGLAVVLLGAAADLAFHVLGPTLPSALIGLFGTDAINAHLLTLAGMVVAVLGLVVQARTSPNP